MLHRRREDQIQEFQIYPHKINEKDHKSRLLKEKEKFNTNFKECIGAGRSAYPLNSVLLISPL